MLTEIAIKNLKPRDKEYKLSDGNSLYLHVRKTGVKIWRFRFRLGGKILETTLGHWPEITSKRARELREDARKLVRQGINPNQQRRDIVQANITASKNTFKAIAMRWWEEDYKVSSDTREATLSRLKRYLFPKIGNRPLADISAGEIKSVLKGIKPVGTGVRLKTTCRQIFGYAVEHEIVKYNIVRDLSGFKKPRTKNHAAVLDPKRLGELMRAIDGMGGEPTTQVAMQLLPLIIPRKTELISMKWAELDFDKAEWHRHVSKTDIDNVSPLPEQAVALIESLRPLTGHTEYVFWSNRTKSGHIGRTTLNEALKAIGFHGEHTLHGFRTSATTLLIESGWPKQYVDAQMAHRVKDSNGLAYDRAQYLADRKAMLQQWADYLDSLKNPSNNVFLLKKQANR